MKPFLQDISHGDLLRQLSYDASTGTFRWLISKGGNARIGQEAGCVNAVGYRAILINRRNYLAHRLAWFYVKGAWPQFMIDHADRNRLNNAIGNLREATNSQNQGNKYSIGFSERVDPAHPDRVNKFESRIGVDGKLKHLGCFPTAEAARAAYIDAHRAHFGEFSSSEVDAIDVSQSVTASI